MIDQHTLWNDRARTLGDKAGTQDRIAKQLEIEAIARYVHDGMRVLDAGCGDGETAIELARRYDITIHGFDQSEEMVEHARVRGLPAMVSDLCCWTIGDYDLIFTERVIINLPSWEEQLRAIQHLISLLKSGGLYVMCECCHEGVDNLNSLRHTLDLPPIIPPPHNRYLHEGEIWGAVLTGVLPSVREEPFSGTYYLLSRVLNAALAHGVGHDPHYDSPLNELALRLPEMLPDLAQGRIWAFRRLE